MSIVTMLNALTELIKSHTKEMHHDLTKLKAGFNPEQPRVPAGSSEGGQWTEGQNKPLFRQKPRLPRLSSSLLSTQITGVNLIIHHEGFKPQPYDDGAGNITIGYGHKLEEGEKFPNGVTKEEARQILNRDLEESEAAIHKLVKVPLNQNQFDALSAFVFNIGYNQFRRSSLLALLNQEDYIGAADQFLRWNKIRKHGVLQISRGLTRRRHDERELFLNENQP